MAGKSKERAAATLQELEEPPLCPSLSPEEILTGPQLAPEKRIQTYDEDEFEAFVHEWAFHYLQKSGEYVRVRRLGGAGDLGRDVVGLVKEPLRAKGFDIFQCKHYASPLVPSEIWTELGKLCVFTHLKRFPVPRRYCLIAPRDTGPTLADLLEDADALRAGLIENWTNKCAAQISKSQKFPLVGALKKHVDRFPFKIVSCKPIHEVIDEFRSTSRFAARFGGGLSPIPPPQSPPDRPQPSETIYVRKLLAAYSDESGQEINSVDEVRDSEYRDDFSNQRVRYYYAETLKQFARDTLSAEFTYDELREQTYQGVIDVVRSAHSSGYQRLLNTMTAAGAVVLSAHPLANRVHPQSKQGMCHQLANDGRISWVPGGDD